MDDPKNSGEAQHKTCLNCGTVLAGKFCSLCGQKDLPRRQNLGDLIVNFVGSFTSFESKFFRTFSMLLFRPGRIVKDYNAGKRESYYHPARMYVFLSFVFFLLFTILPDTDVVDLQVDGRTLSKDERAAVLDTIDWSSIDWSSYDPKTVREYDSIEAAKPPGERDGWIEQYVTKKFIILRQQQGGNYEAVIKSFLESFGNNTPKMIFLLLPVFALILKLLYIRRDFFYSEHLIFSVFFYDFLYLAGIIGLLFSMVDWLEWLQAVIILLTLFYLYKAMRKVYGQSRGKTILKFLLLFCTFSFILLFALIANALITFMLM